MAILRASIALLTAWLSITNAYPTAGVDSTELAPPELDLSEAYNGTLVKRYNDGEGTYIDSDSEHHYASGVKCWNDWFIVGQTLTWGEWYPASGKVYCTGTSSCQVSKMTGTQKCETWSIGISAGIEWKIAQFGANMGYALQKCSSAQDTTSCTWNDGQCHVVWAQHQYLVQGGYTRRRCHDKGRDYTAWMKEFEHRSPTSSLAYGCGSKCSDS